MGDRTMSVASDTIVNDIKEAQTEREFWASRILAVLQGKTLPAIDKGKQYRLLDLALRFGFDAFETDLVTTLWISLYSNELRRELMRFDVLENHISPLLISKLFQHKLIYRLGSESPLRLWGIVREHESLDGSIALTLDPQIVAWLDGSNELDRVLIDKASVVPHSFVLASWQKEEIVKKIRACLEKEQRCRIYLDTDDTELAKAYASYLAGYLGLYVLQIDLMNVPVDELAHYTMHIHRQAFLDTCAPFIHNQFERLTYLNGVTSFPVQFVYGSSPVVNETNLRDIIISIPKLTPLERKQIWQQYLQNHAQWQAEALDDLVWHFELTASEIIKIAKRDPDTPQQASALIRQNTEDDLGALAQKISTDFSWDDLIVPDQVNTRLTEIVFEARERAKLWSNPQASRLFPHGRGLVALFSGPPGSGKSMAAQVIAAELGLDLLRVDLSAVVSKWVGETAENLQKILSSEMSKRAVLFFDEADALYSKRVDEVKTAQDKYSNMDSGHLMVALENYDGIVLMATNLRANIDPAFIRRIRHTVEFEKPTETARSQIWIQAIRGLFGEQEALGLQTAVDNLARLEATGAQIKNACLSAYFASRNTDVSLDKYLLGSMLTRELAKDGKGLSERELSSVVGG
jgi:AAA+ superfamily predicted ATPase